MVWIFCTGMFPGLETSRTGTPTRAFVLGRLELGSTAWFYWVFGRSARTLGVRAANSCPISGHGVASLFLRRRRLPLRSADHETLQTAATSAPSASLGPFQL